MEVKNEEMAKSVEARACGTVTPLRQSPDFKSINSSFGSERKLVAAALGTGPKGGLTRNGDTCTSG